MSDQSRGCTAEWAAVCIPRNRGDDFASEGRARKTGRERGSFASKKISEGLAVRVCDPQRTVRQRLPRGAALPRLPPDEFPVVLGQLPPEEPLPDRPSLPVDLAPLDEPFDAPPALPRVPPWLPLAPLLIAASVENTEVRRYSPCLMNKVAHGNCDHRIKILLLVPVSMLYIGCLN